MIVSVELLAQCGTIYLRLAKTFAAIHLTTFTGYMNYPLPPRLLTFRLASLPTTSPHFSRQIKASQIVLAP